MPSPLKTNINTLRLDGKFAVVPMLNTFVDRLGDLEDDRECRGHCIYSFSCTAHGLVLTISSPVLTTAGGHAVSHGLPRPFVCFPPLKCKRSNTDVISAFGATFV